jgi:hypothetical protein
MAVLIVAAGFVLYWAAATLAVRPTLPGETEVLFEASRLRAGLPLYVDPAAGAQDYGVLPARYLVTYPPLWSWVLSHLPAGAPALVFARVASAAAWLGALAWLASRARPGCRAQALAAAAFYAGTFNLALFAMSGRPDSIAVLLAAVALARAVRAERVDALSGALFALAAWTKPTVIGLAAGALVADLLSRRRSGAGFAGAAVVSALAVMALEAASGQAWLSHLVRSNLQPISVAVWVDAMRHDAFFFVAPAAYALLTGWQRRRRPDVVIALAALAVSFGWALFSRAKIGSSTNYWMESSVGVLAVCASAPAPTAASRPALVALALVQALWVGIASVRSAIYRVEADTRIAELLDHARASCGACPADFVMSDDPAAELITDGRIYTTGYQMTFLALARDYPLAPWLADIERPEVACFVEHTGIMRIVPELAQALDAKFTPVASTDDWTVLRASRARPSCAGPTPAPPGSPPAPGGP